jgi:hypothetical protein
VTSSTKSGLSVTIQHSVVILNYFANSIKTSGDKIKFDETPFHSVVTQYVKDTFGKSGRIWNKFYITILSVVDSSEACYFGHYTSSKM